MNRKHEDLGKLAYTHTKEDHMATFSGNSEFFDIVNRIDELKKEIEDKNDEIEKIKVEYGIDDNDILNVEPDDNKESQENIDVLEEK